VPAQAGASQSFEAAAAQQRLGAVDVDCKRPRLHRELDRALVLTDPIRQVGMQVQVMPAVERPRSRHPEPERTVAEVERSVDVSVAAAHRQALAFHRDDCRPRALITYLVDEAGGFRCRCKRLLVALGPKKCVSECNQGVEPVFAV
jgi:hypothetical protein